MKRASWLGENSSRKIFSLPFKTRAGVLLAATTLGCALNLAPIKLDWGVDLLMGAVPIWAVFFIVGRPLALAGFAIVSLGTIMLWHHPWAYGIFLAEAVTVALLSRRLPLMFAEIIYWLIFGIPAVFLSYTFILNMEPSDVDLIMTKQPLNAFLCAAVGLVIYHVIVLLLPTKTPNLRGSLSLYDLCISYALTVALIPMFITMELNGRYRQLEKEDSISVTLKAKIELAAHILLSIEQKLTVYYGGDCIAGTNTDLFVLCGNYDLFYQVKKFLGNNTLLYVLADGKHIYSFNNSSNENTILSLKSNFSPEFASNNTYKKKFPLQGLFSHEPAAMTVDKNKKITARYSTVFNRTLYEFYGTIDLSEEVISRRKFLTMDLFLVFICTAIITLAVLYGSKRLKRILFFINESLDFFIKSDRITVGSNYSMIREIDLLYTSISTALDPAIKDRLAFVDFSDRIMEIEKNAPLCFYSSNIIDGKRVSMTGALPALVDFKWHTGDLSIKWWLGAIHPDDRETASFMPQLLKPGMPASAEYRLLNAAGQYIWILDILIYSKDEVNGSIDAYGILIEITKRKLAELQLAQTAKLSYLGEMATNLAHELNQPLNIIKLAASNAMRVLDAENQDVDYLRRRLLRINKQVDRASELISHMRIFGRTPAGGPHPISLNSAIENAIKLVTAELGAANIDCRIFNQFGFPQVLGHETLLEQVLVNLILNARDAILENRSQVDLHASAADIDLITIIYNKVGTNVHLTIEDTGGGIDNALINKIFDPFFTTKDVGKGTGLGLSISFGLVRDMGGILSVKNGTNGAQFMIVLPVLEVEDGFHVEAQRYQTNLI